MAVWLLSSGKKTFRLSDCIQKHSFVYWSQRNRVNVDDLMLIYVSAPIKAIKYLMKVTETGRTINQIIDNEEFWIDKSIYEKGRVRNCYFRIDLVKEYGSDKGLTYYDLSHNGLGCLQGMQKIEGEKLCYFQKIGII